MVNINLKDILEFHRSAWISGGVTLACVVLLLRFWGELPQATLVGLVFLAGAFAGATAQAMDTARKERRSEQARIRATDARHNEIRRRISLLDEREKQVLLGAFEAAPIWYDDYDQSWEKAETHLVNLELLERSRLGVYVPPDVQDVIRRMLCEQEEARRAAT